MNDLSNRRYKETVRARAHHAAPHARCRPMNPSQLVKLLTCARSRAAARFGETPPSAVGGAREIKGDLRPGQPGDGSADGHVQTARGHVRRTVAHWPVRYHGASVDAQAAHQVAQRDAKDARKCREEARDGGCGGERLRPGGGGGAEGRAGAHEAAGAHAAAAAHLKPASTSSRARLLRGQLSPMLRPSVDRMPSARLARSQVHLRGSAVIYETLMDSKRS